MKPMLDFPKRPRRLATALLCLSLLAILLSGCFLAPSREINMLVTKNPSGGSDVTITYRVAAPKTGIVYVLWLVNPEVGKEIRIGTVEPSTRLRAIKTKVDFWPTGAVISKEASTNVDRMSDDWALFSGQVEATGTLAGAGR